jgi:hypothetical protein
VGPDGVFLQVWGEEVGRGIIVTQQDAHGLITSLVHGQDGNMTQLCDEQKPLSLVDGSRSSIIHQRDEVIDLLWVHGKFPSCHFV